MKCKFEGHEKYQEAYTALARLLRRPWLEAKAAVDRADIQIRNDPAQIEAALAAAEKALGASTPKRKALLRRAVIEAIKTDLFVIGRFYGGTVVVTDCRLREFLDEF